MQKATFEDLIARKMQREKDKLRIKEIKIPSLGKALVFKKPKDESIIDAAGAAITAKDGDVTRLFEAYKKIIYMCCEALQNPELHKEMGVVDPLDTVQAIMEPEEIMDVGNDLLEFVDLEKVDEDVKN